MKYSVSLLALVMCCGAFAAEVGQVIPNLSKMWTVWNGRTVDWFKTKNRDYPTDFVKYVELMTATGGSPERDCLKNPLDKTVLDDYDFEPLVKMCRGVVDMGAKPYIKIGGVPGKYTEEYDGGRFKSNVCPPKDPMDNYRYLRACAAALKDAFGCDEVRSWRFAVLTEADNFAWFKVGDKDVVRTREAYFALYDYAVKALEDELGTGLTVGTHLLDPSDAQDLAHSFTATEFAQHCLSGTNAATGKVGTPLSLLTFSNYHAEGYMPPLSGKRVGEMKAVAQELAAVRALGYTNLVVGTDEGRIISGAKGAFRGDLYTRATGSSYEAAYDVRLVQTALDLGFDYLTTWGWFSGPEKFEGVPSHHYFSMREISRFEGYKLLSAGDDVISAVSPDGKKVRAMVGCFTDKFYWTQTSTRSVLLKLPRRRFAGKKVLVSTLKLDDRNNWFVDWMADRAQFGIDDKSFGWSPDDLAVMSGRGLTNKVFRTMFENVLQPYYAKKARSVDCVDTVVEVASDGTLKLDIDFAGNGAAFLEISEYRSVPYFKPGERVLFLGDSITHGGRYIYYLQLFENLRNPGSGVRLMNGGRSGGNASTGLEIFDREMKKSTPDRMFVMFGMNDSNGESMRKVYKKNIATILDRLAAADVESVLITPTPFDEYSELKAANNPSRNDVSLSRLAGEVRELASERGIPYVDFHRPMTKLVRENTNTFQLAKDRVHPGNEGHLLMAAYILEAMGVSPEVARVSVVSEDGKGASFDYAPKSLPFPKMAEYLNDLKYYPLTEKLNQEIIQVKGLKPGEYTIAFDGKSVGVFAAEEFAQGVNVALLDTPNQLKAHELVPVMRELQSVMAKYRNVVLVTRMVEDAKVDPSDWTAADAYLDKWLDDRKDRSYYPGVKAWVDQYREGRAKESATLAKIETLYARLASVRPSSSHVTITPVQR